MPKMLLLVLLAIGSLTGCGVDLDAPCPAALEGGVAERGMDHGCQIDGMTLQRARVNGASGYWTADPMQAVRATGQTVTSGGLLYLPGDHAWCTDLDAAPKSALGHFLCA